MHSLFTRLVVAAVAAAGLTALVGAAWERARFGADAGAARARLESEVQHRLEDVAARLRAATDAVARDGALIDRAATNRDGLPDLFARLEATRLPNAPVHALTVYVPDGAGAHRLLAWSDGPAEDLDIRPMLGADATTPATLVVPGTLGLRLVALAPVHHEGRQVGVVTAERVIASGESPVRHAGRYALLTSLGNITIAPAVVRREGPQPLVDIIHDPASIDAARRLFRHRVWALALLPLVLLAVAGVTRVILQRRPPAPSRRFVAWSAAHALAQLAGGLALVGLARLAVLPAAVDYLLLGIAAMGAAVALPVAVWWRGGARRAFRDQPIRAGLELLASGTAAMVVLAGTGVVIDVQLQSAGLDRLASPLFPVSGTLLVSHLIRLSLALSAVWTVVALHATIIERWRIHWYDPGPAALSILLGCLPAAVLSLTSIGVATLTIVAPIALGIAVAAAVAALAASPVRRRYRRTSQSTRLLLLFGATVLPALVVDPIASVSAQRATETVIERVHAPATVGHAEHLREALARATEEIDRMAELAALVSRPPEDTGISTDAAFEVWSQTGLSRARLTSAVELYGATGTLLSRFALNVPEYGIDQSSADIGCDWEVYGEVGTFGAEELRMLHAERGVCDESGVPRGAVVLHVIFDYRALPYLSARNPYDDLLRAEDQPPAAAPRGIEVVVYGWSRLPLFVSGPTAWTIDDALLSRLERSRTPFWTTRQTDAGTSRVYFMNDRAGIYALAYPMPSLFAHLTRLSETAALAALVFLLLVAGTTLAAPLTRRPDAPLRAVVAEVRTSFYRKLFLFFVLTAIIPVVALALTFSAYMGDQLRSDVETEAVNAVTVARRVLEDTIALQQVPLTDDVMVWIGRVINQDVNVYDGPRLRATSQRDLFSSGMLPERTPARAYRAVALDRVPTFVEEHRAGPLTYLVAAAPVPGLGRHAVIAVPLAPRQQEIEREISDLNRGVLFGAVVVLLLSAGFGAWVAQRVADPVARLTRATRQIASGRLDVRIVADTADELQRLVTDFNSMAATLRDQRAELGRTHELKAWADMSRQVAHDIKNPLTPIQLAAEHLQRVHDDRQRPLGPVFDQCITTVLRQVKLLRQIANDFSNFAASPVPTLVAVPVADLLHDVIRPYRAGLAAHMAIETTVPPGLPPVLADRTLLARALTNLVENALQAMPDGGTLRLTAALDGAEVVMVVADEGVGMTQEALARAFEPHFSTKTGGSGLGLANARRNIESCGGSISASSEPGRGTTMTIRLPGAEPDAAGGA